MVRLRRLLEEVASRQVAGVVGGDLAVSASPSLERPEVVQQQLEMLETRAVSCFRLQQFVSPKQTKQLVSAIPSPRPHFHSCGHHRSFHPLQPLQ